MIDGVRGRWNQIRRQQKRVDLFQWCCLYGSIHFLSHQTWTPTVSFCLVHKIFYQTTLHTKDAKKNCLLNCFRISVETFIVSSFFAIIFYGIAVPSVGSKENGSLLSKKECKLYKVRCNTLYTEFCPYWTLCPLSCKTREVLTDVAGLPATRINGHAHQPAPGTVANLNPLSVKLLHI